MAFSVGPSSFIDLACSEEGRSLFTDSHLAQNDDDEVFADSVMYQDPEPEETIPGRDIDQKRTAFPPHTLQRKREGSASLSNFEPNKRFALEDVTNAALHVSDFARKEDTLRSSKAPLVQQPRAQPALCLQQQQQKPSATFGVIGSHRPAQQQPQKDTDVSSRAFSSALPASTTRAPPSLASFAPAASSSSSLFSFSEHLSLNHSTQSDYSVANLSTDSTQSQGECDNIDSADKMLPQMVSDYIEDIMANLRRKETELMPKRGFMSHQKHVSVSMRAILCDWIIDVAAEYKLAAQSLFLSVNYLDRFLSAMNVPRHRLQLVGLACLFLAAKVEEVYPPTLAEFAYIADNTYSDDHILRMELLVLRVLQYRVHPPTVREFSVRFLKAASASYPVRALTDYLCELTLLHESFHVFRPSLISASAVFVARLFHDVSDWTPTLLHYTQYSPSDMYECSRSLYVMYRNASSHTLRAVYEKYAHETYARVSQRPISRIVLQYFGDSQ